MPETIFILLLIHLLLFVIPLICMADEAKTKKEGARLVMYILFPVVSWVVLGAVAAVKWWNGLE